VPDAFDQSKSTLFIYGSLEEGDDVRIRRMVEELGIDNFAATVLESEGGDVETAFRLSDLINRDMNKKVFVIGECMSACAFIALAAGPKLVVSGGTLSVHEVWVKDGQADLKLTKQIVEWLRGCGVTESILRKIMNTIPANMSAITKDELRAMGAVVQ
jgi:hypothetical protein